MVKIPVHNKKHISYATHQDILDVLGEETYKKLKVWLHCKLQAVVDGKFVVYKHQLEDFLTYQGLCQEVDL